MRQHPGATWFAVILAAAIVLVIVFGGIQVFHKAKTPPQTTNASLRLGPGTAPTAPNRTLREGATATAIAAGDYTTCALVAGATADCWGDGAHGQLGDGAKENSLVPTPVRGLPVGVISIAVGGSHACAVLEDGSVECWGAGAHGALGDGSTADAAAPVSVRGIHSAIAVAAGVAHTCALLRGGTVECWGANSNGQLGNGATHDSAVPVTVLGISGATAITAGLAHTCALRADGTVNCWGANENGELGDAKTIDSPTPVAVTGLSGATAVDAGDAHTCALLADGSIDCWGWNIEGQLGNGGGDSSIPVAVAGIRHAMALTTGGSHTCTLVRSGAVECWGANLYGQLGNGTTSDSSSPVAVPGLASGVTAIGAGLYDTCALLTGGSATCWGWNAHGQLGDGATTTTSTPVGVAGLGLAQDGSGAIAATPTALPSSATHVTISFDYTAAPGGMHDGALEILVPHGWSLPSTTRTEPGFTTASAGHLTVSGRSIHIAQLNLASHERLTIAYGSTAQGGPGALVKEGSRSSWQTREQSSSSGALSPLSISPTVAALPPDGSGTLTAVTTSVPSGARNRTLRFVYRAAKGGLLGGSVTLDVPLGWSHPTVVPSRAGYASASQGVVSVVGRTIIVSRLVLSTKTLLTITYHAGAPAANVGSQRWAAQARSGVAGALQPLAFSPYVTVLSADGSGLVSESPDAVPSGARHLSITFTYLAQGGGLNGGVVSLTVPAGWSPPSTRPATAGYVTASTGRPVVHGRTITLPVEKLGGGEALSLTYGSTSTGGTGAVAPGGVAGAEQWSVEERSSPAGVLKPLASPPRIAVLSRDGSGTLLRASGSVAPGSHGDTVVFVFTTAKGGLSGGAIQLTVPAGWTDPSTDPASGGYVSASPGSVTVNGRRITISDLTLADTELLTIVYGSRSGGGPGASAPAGGLGPSIWPVSERSSVSGSFKRLLGR